ncbi:unnamed protein product [Lactuca virosa]|uniref:Uncharacterized protein n=1 Tax=Lactuca virosa TaxID=75947 RepID=A0AAU9M8Y6_9ASTR|nr:unnamed protein product [Lactuca virosa]
MFIKLSFSKHIFHIICNYIKEKLIKSSTNIEKKNFRLHLERSRFSDRDGYIVNLEGLKVILLARMVEFRLFTTILLKGDNSWEEIELTHTVIDKAQCVQAFVSELNPDTNTNTEELPISSSQLLLHSYLQKCHFQVLRV